MPLTPRYGWDDVKAFCRGAGADHGRGGARSATSRSPTKAKRSGRIFIDYLRNGRGATAICPFSTRARRGAPVSWPVTWAQLARLDKRAGRRRSRTPRTLLRKQKTDPWTGYFDVDQVLPLEKLGR